MDAAVSTRRPRDEAELSEAIASARGPFRVIGGGTRGLECAEACETLSASAISGIREYEPGALTLVAAAGTPAEEVEGALRAEGQTLAFEPMDHRGLLGTEGTPTIGGVAAANVSGPRRPHCGACRDMLLGVRFVDGQGTVTTNGGRVMKNVTGYDLVRLMAGSHGTLGVLTEVSLKALPLPEATGVALVNGLEDASAVRAMSKALGSPYDVSGAAHACRGVDGHPVTMIRVEGFEGSVRHRLDRLKDLLGEFGEVLEETDPARTAAGWAWIRDVEAFHGREGDVWRVSVRPTDGPGVAEAARRAVEAEVVYDWGGGLVWLLVPKGTDARSLLGGLRGHATLVRADKETRSRLGTFHPEPPEVRALSSELRRRFDPRGILNPGLAG